MPSRLLRGLLAALAVVPLLALWPAAPAAAHGGPLELDLAGDGATGVTVRAAYKQDGHPVEDQVLRLVLNATGEGGRRVGPVQLDPANEGQGFYTSGAVLTPGRWTVVVTSPEPNPGKAEATVEARVAQTAPPPQAAPTDPGGGGTWRWWVAGAALLLGAVVALALVSRHRAKAAAR
ncbi:hypothetical protein RB614_08105 [Phytohabitans sp. ZYX-F-186]|uniref:YtkA-like domain-containing protein n=1 Tax=Phytohabitans maris TaxID=3071409 RepID=A0ABU0ZBN8_9ACTN|nr:hypothetical protein [Phytohabitans sp. ZYX-F-186]MDQ7904485.1 hypothetical protein [Phytohabitans sp. ZYX-F-186]